MDAVVSLENGTFLGSYEIIAPIRAGGMGEVYRARDHKLDRDVAIKVLPENLADDRGRRERFEREARAASALNHPNIITIHDIGSHASSLYIVMESEGSEGALGRTIMTKKKRSTRSSRRG